MTKILVLLSASLVLAACSYHSPVANYSGPIATLSDGSKRISNSKVEYYVASAVNGQIIENSLTRQKIMSSGGRGQRQDIIKFDRDIPVNKALSINALGVIKRPRSLQNIPFDNRDINGTLTFTPEAGKHYVLTGQLNEQYRGIWVTEANTGLVVSNRVEVSLSSDLEPASSGR